MPAAVDPEADTRPATGKDARIDDAVTQPAGTPLRPSGDELPPMPPGHPGDPGDPGAADPGDVEGDATS
jgi:hypothetical protein